MVSGPLQACSLFIPLAHRWLLCQSRGEYPWDSTVTHSPALLVTPKQGWQSRVVPLGLNIHTTELAWNGGLVSWLLCDPCITKVVLCVKGVLYFIIHCASLIYPFSGVDRLLCSAQGIAVLLLLLMLWFHLSCWPAATELVIGIERKWRPVLYFPHKWVRKHTKKNAFTSRGKSILLFFQKKTSELNLHFCFALKFCPV